MRIRLFLITAGLFGLFVTWWILSLRRGGQASGSVIPDELILFGIAIVGMLAGFLWINKIVDDVGKV